MDETTGKIYEQASENWRFLAKWRQLALAGYLAVLAGALSFINSATERAYPRPIVGCCFLLLAGICFIFWITDRRTHRLTMHACEAAAEWEEGTRPGFFRVNAKSDKKDDVRHSGRRGWRMDGHTWAAYLLFLGSMVIFGVLGVLVLTSTIPWPSGNSTAWEYTVVRGSVTSTGTSSDSLEKDLSRASAEGWEFVAIGNDSGGGILVILRRHRR